MSGFGQNGSKVLQENILCTESCLKAALEVNLQYDGKLYTAFALKWP